MEGQGRLMARIPSPTQQQHTHRAPCSSGGWYLSTLKSSLVWTDWHQLEVIPAINGETNSKTAMARHAAIHYTCHNALLLHTEQALRNFLCDPCCDLLLPSLVYKSRKCQKSIQHMQEPCSSPSCLPPQTATHQGLHLSPLFQTEAQFRRLD